MILHRQANLPKVVLAVTSPRRFARRLNCGQQQGNERSDNCDDYQQLHEREAE
jgi:hypothetical protein